MAVELEVEHIPRQPVRRECRLASMPPATVKASKTVTPVLPGQLVGTRQPGWTRAYHGDR